MFYTGIIYVPVLPWRALYAEVDIARKHRPPGWPQAMAYRIQNDVPAICA